jgi:broad specificity phosphatase PhoE
MTVAGHVSNSFTPDLLMMRHGQTEANAARRSQGSDDPLTEEGKRQVELSARNLGRLVRSSVILLDRPLEVHHGPLPRQIQSWKIAEKALSDFGIHPAIVEEREELAERITDPSVRGSDYDRDFVSPDNLHESWYIFHRRVEPYVRELKEERGSRQLLCVTSGGFGGMMNMELTFGTEETLRMLDHDAEHGPDDFDAGSSQYYLNKIPNAAIDIWSVRESNRHVARVLPIPSPENETELFT